MKEADLLPTTTAITKPETSSSSLFGKNRYKFWALAAIILLAFWSMLTGTVSLNFSAGDLLPDDYILHHSSMSSDLDVLEVEEREKLVKHMWDVYNSQSRRIQLPKFWQEAFEAAYEELASDDVEVRDSAILEIAKMSMRMVDLEPPSRFRKNGDVNYLRKEIARAKPAKSSYHVR